MKKHLYIKLVLIFLISLLQINLIGQTTIGPFTFYTTNQGGVMQGQAQINSSPAVSGDIIAAFDPGGECVGAASLIINGGLAYINFVIYGDDGGGHGMSAGEAFTLKIYDASASIVLTYPTALTGWQNTNFTPMPGYNNPSTIYNFASTILIPTVTTTAASNIAQTTATSGGNVTSDGGASVTAKGVCWNTTGSPTIANPKTTDGTGIGVFISSITGLSPSTLYYVRAYATNSAGTAYGLPLTFTTTGTVVIPTITTTAASNIAQTTATSGGNVTSDGGASVTAKGVCWNTTGNPTIANPKTTDGTGIGVFISSITGLSPSTLYYVRAYATNSAGTAYGLPLTFTTLATVVVPTITTTAASNIAQTTATSGGNITSDGGASVTAKGVCWNTTGSPTITDAKTTDGTGIGVFISSITGLSPSTLYYVRAYATNSAGTVYGLALTFTTLSTVVVPTVTTTAVSNIAQTTVTSGGNATSDGGASVTAKGVCWSTSATPTISNSKTTDGIGTGIFSSAVTGLVPGTTYFLRAYATNSFGTGYGNQATFTTLALPANAAPVTTAGSIGAGVGYPATVPITVTGFNNITGISLRVDYNPNVMTLSSGTNINALLAGMIFNDNHVSVDLHKVLISWANSNPVTLANYSKLIDLVFTYISGTSLVTFNNESNGGSDCEYADANGDPLNDFPTATYYINGEVHPGLNITGTFMYNNTANTALDSLWVILKQNGVKVDSSRANINGQYVFIGKTSGTYTIAANCTKPWGGVNSTDAIKVERHFVGIEPFTVPVRLLAGDVNNTNYINATDASKIKRRFVGLETSFARGDWVFAKPTGGDTVIVAGTNIVQDFQGLCTGDVNGSNIPASGDAAKTSVSLTTEGIMEVMQGDEFELPVRIGQSEQITAISLVLGYQPENLELMNVSISQENVLYTAQNGQIRIAWSQVEPLNLATGDVLLTIKFRLSNVAPLGIPIALIIENESELANGWGEPISNALISMPSVLPVKPNGVNEKGNLITRFILYPNPATNKAWLEFELTMGADIVVEWYNVVGELMATIRFDGLSAGKHKLELDASNFNNGVYTLKTRVAGRTASTVHHKIVISK